MRSIVAQPIPVRAVTLSAVAALIISLVALVAPVSSANPPGNNGTVKIDGVPFDDHPNNEPHPGCVFQVDFYGYDAGALFASVTFEHWNPTGDGHGDVLLHEEGIWIGEDDNSGGGSQAGLDASRTYNLSAQLAAMSPHPQQGHHIKLTVHADGSQGADVKHKVFWVECPGGGGGEQGQVLLQKVDQTGAGRAGAVFTLTGVTNPSFRATATTSATGSAGFSALVAGTYALAETTPPSGCTGFAGSITITVAANGTVTFGTLPTGVSVVSGTVRVVNNCGGGTLPSVPVLKVDQAGAGKAGAVFTLSGVSGTSFSATATTGATGSAAFSGLSAGSYTLAETTPPTGCTGFAGTLAITIAANGTVTFGTLPTGVSIVSGTVRVVNNCGGGTLPTVPVLKVDQAGAGRAGAVFTLTGVSGTSLSATATSGATGAAAFSGLSAGSYTLAETTPPTGCTGFVGTLAITIAANGAVTFGTLPTGVSIVSGTVRVVNTCGGVSAGGGGVSAGGGQVSSREGTLSSAAAGGGGVSALPNTAVDAIADPLPAVLLTLLLVAGLGAGAYRMATSPRRRR